MIQNRNQAAKLISLMNMIIILINSWPANEPPNQAREHKDINDPRCKHTADAILNALLAEVIYVLLLLWNEPVMYSLCQGEWFIFILGYFSQP